MAKDKVVEQQKPLSATQLQEIVALAKRQEGLEQLVEDLEHSLAALRQELEAVAEGDLPLAMKEAGLKKFTLESGEVIEIKEAWAVGILAENRPRVWDWLERKGFGGLIKTQVGIEFGKGEMDKAQKLVAELSKKKLTPILTRDIHYQTLKAFVTEQMRDAKAAKAFPLDLFGARETNKAKITLPKSTERKQ